MRSRASTASLPQLGPSGLRRPYGWGALIWAWTALSALLSFLLGNLNLSQTWLVVSGSEDIQHELAVLDLRKTDLKMAHKLAREVL